MLGLTIVPIMAPSGRDISSNINSDENLVGAENIGFMPFPAVEGGAGDIDQYPANAGAAMAINPKTYGPDTEAWFSCIAENYGAQALGEPDVVTVAVGEQDAADVVERATDGIQLAGEVGVHAGEAGVDEGDALGRDDQVGGDDVVADAVQ